MSSYTDPGLNIDHHPQTTIGPESLSTPTIISDTNIAAPSDLSSSGIVGESFSSQPLSLLVGSTDTSIPRSTGVNQFTRHKRFFFDDGNIIFLVDDVLYRVHRYHFCRGSEAFKTRLSQLPTQGASSLPTITIENVKSKDFDAFCSVLYPLDFDESEEYSLEELSSILYLSTRWGFTSIRNMAIRRLNPPTPHQRLILGRKYGLDQELCERPEPPTRDEARLMGPEDVILVGSVSEKVRTHSLTANLAGITDRIKTWGSVGPLEQPAGVPAPVFAVPSLVPVEVLVEGQRRRGPEPPTDEGFPEPPADEDWPELPTDEDWHELPTDEDWPELPTDEDRPELPTDEDLFEPSTDDDLPEPPADWPESLTYEDWPEPPTYEDWPEPPTDLFEPPTDDDLPEPPVDNDWPDLLTNEDWPDLPTNEDWPDLSTDGYWAEPPTDEDWPDSLTDLSWGSG